MTPPPRYSPVEWCGLAVAAAVTALGATMAIAWWFELVELIRFVNSGPTLRFNTATMFALSGLTLACNILGHRRAAVSLAIVVFLFALLCTAKNLNLIVLDVEHLLYRPSEFMEQSFAPGKVALGTSIAFLLFSLAMLAQISLRYGDVIALLLGIVICMISWVALSHYFICANEEVGWCVTSGMACTTSVGLLLLGIAMIALSCGPLQTAQSTHWLPYSLAVALAAVSFMIWRELVDNETRHLRHETKAAAESIRLAIRERIEGRAKAIDRLTVRWAQHDHEAKSADVRRLLEDFMGIAAIYGVSPDCRVNWVDGLEDPLQFLGSTIPPGPRHDAVRHACNTCRFTFTPVIQLITNEPGFIGYAPTLGSDGDVDGCIAAVFQLQPFLNAIATDRRHLGFEFAIYEAERSVFSSKTAPLPAPYLTQTTNLDLLGLNWRFAVWPNDRTIAGHYTYAPSLAFATGLLSAFLVGIVVQLRQRALQRTTEALSIAEALHNSQQRFDLAVRGSRDGIWEWRAGADGYYASPHYREMLGYPLDDAPLSEQTWFARIHPDDLPHIRQALEDHFQGGVHYDVVVRFFNFRNEWVWLRVRGQCDCDESRQPVRMAGSITDITEEREAQRQLLQHVETIAESNKALAELAEAAEAAADAKATFLRNMSHELRTPLNSIIGFSTGLLRHVAAHNLDEHQRDRIERIAASGRHLLGLVNNVLDIAKAEASDQSHQPEPFELAALLDEITAMTEALLQKKHAVKFSVRIAHDAPIPILDRAKLKQILLNLISNAAKFTDNGTIAITVAYVLEGWSFAVADTGIGIPVDDHLRVFENFEQVRTPGRNVEGTGLGLSICAALAHAMGGQIALISRLGIGSTFTLLVPQGTESPHSDDDSLMEASVTANAPVAQPT